MSCICLFFVARTSVYYRTRYVCPIDDFIFVFLCLLIRITVVCRHIWRVCPKLRGENYRGQRGERVHSDWRERVRDRPDYIRRMGLQRRHPIAAGRFQRVQVPEFRQHTLPVQHTRVLRQMPTGTYIISRYVDVGSWTIPSSVQYMFNPPTFVFNVWPIISYFKCGNYRFFCLSQCFSTFVLWRNTIKIFHILWHTVKEKGNE